MTFTVPDGFHLPTDKWECLDCGCEFFCDLGDDCPDCKGTNVVRSDK